MGPLRLSPDCSVCGKGSSLPDLKGRKMFRCQRCASCFCGSCLADRERLGRRFSCQYVGHAMSELPRRETGVCSHCFTGSSGPFTSRAEELERTRDPMSFRTTLYKCENCGRVLCGSCHCSEPAWLGQCPHCGHDLTEVA